MKWPRRESRLREAPPSDATSVASGEPAPRAAVVRSLEEESHETITLLDVSRHARAQKQAAERGLYADAGELDFAEHEWRRERRETLDEVRNLVDAMPPRGARETAGPVPSEPAPATAPAPWPPPAEAREERGPERPAPEAEPLGDADRALLEWREAGELVHAGVLYATKSGRVVDARYRDADGRELRRLFLLARGEVKDVADVEARVDALRPRRPLPRAPEPPTAPEPDPPTEVEPDAVAPGEEVAPPAPPLPTSEAPPARTGFFGRAGARPPESGAGSPPRKGRLGLPFGKKSSPAPGDEPPPSEADGPKRRRFTFGKKG